MLLILMCVCVCSEVVQRVTLKLERGEEEECKMAGCA